jgi:secreted Zn-dependent insulinase-like peptidase
LKLPNDVEIILVNATTNKKLKKNAIGIIVGSGAMNDDKIDGLAHLTEHMLFLVKHILIFREIKNILMQHSSMIL